VLGVLLVVAHVGVDDFFAAAGFTNRVPSGSCAVGGTGEELIRITSTLPMEDAQRVVDALAERELPIVWSGAGRKRVLKANLARRDQVLTLLYSEPDEATPIEDLCTWVEAPRLDQFKNRVILPMHNDRLVEYDRDTETVILLPPGMSTAEALLGE
jgi:hypothetical protein